MPPPESTSLPDSLPTVPLLAALVVQACVTLCILAVPVLAPAVAADLGVPAAQVGLFTSLLYVAATAGALLCPGFIARYGPIRMNQVLMLFCAGALVAAAGGTVALLACAALALGIANALPVPTAALILMRTTPARLRNAAFSIRQAGVPLGGMVAGAVLPPAAVALGWQPALLLLAVPMLVLAFALEPLRRGLDRERRADAPLVAGNPLRALDLLFRNPALRGLSVAAFFFAGTELAFAAFLVAYLTERAGFELVAAGLAMSVFQAGGLAGRLAFGVAADRVRRRVRLLGAIGVGMALAAAVTAFFGPDWPPPAILVVAFAAGFTSGGWTGVGVAEVAHASGMAAAVQATGALTMIMFLGVIVWPSLFSLLVALADSYGLAYGAVAVGAAGAAALLLVESWRNGT